MFFKTLGKQEILFFPKDIFIFLLRKKKFKKAIHKTEDYKIFFLFFSIFMQFAVFDGKDK
jgi:hypothetical protein